MADVAFIYGGGAGNDDFLDRAPSAQIVLDTVAAPGHSGAFFGQDIQVDPNQTITWFPFSGTPSLGTF